MSRELPEPDVFRLSTAHVSRSAEYARDSKQLWEIVVVGWGFLDCCQD